MTTKKPTLLVAETGKQEMFIIREFNAPREQVFRAFTDPEMRPYRLARLARILDEEVVRELHHCHIALFSSARLSR